MIGKVAKIITADIAKMKHVFRYFTKIEHFNGNTMLPGAYKVFYVATGIDIIGTWLKSDWTTSWFLSYSYISC